MWILDVPWPTPPRWHPRAALGRLGALPRPTARERALAWLTCAAVYGGLVLVAVLYRPEPPKPPEPIDVPSGPLTAPVSVPPVHRSGGGGGGGGHWREKIIVRATPVATVTELSHEITAEDPLEPADDTAREGTVSPDGESGSGSGAPGDGEGPGPAGPGDGGGIGVGPPGGGVGAPGPRTLTSELEPPVRVHVVEPEVPLFLRRPGRQAMVALRCIIEQDGSVEVIEVLSDKAGVSEAAIDAVEQWRYRPALHAGQPVAVFLNVKVQFRSE